jgi:thiol:disulfide interchange protein
MSKKISRILFLACISCIFFLQHLHAQNIQFTKGTWNELLEKATKENKLIFVDIYAVWCGPCKLMAKNVFTQAKVADQFNAKFVNYMIDAEKGEGIMLAEKYQVASFPTYLFIDPSGKLVYKIEGAMTADKFSTEAETAIAKFAKK